MAAVPVFIRSIMKKHMANILTVCRMLGSILLLFLAVPSAGFSVVYLVCGLSDMVDGTVARMTNTVSPLGAALDTAADFLFAAVSLIKLLPVVRLPGWLWIWAGAIAVMRAGNVLLGRICRRRWIFLHTGGNKITGFLLFLLPLAVSLSVFRIYAAVVCSAATLAALQECRVILKGGDTVTEGQTVKRKAAQSDLP